MLHSATLLESLQMVDMKEGEKPLHLATIPGTFINYTKMATKAGKYA